jgi:hypothetical protein
MTPELGRAVHAVLPHEQIAPKKFPMTSKAVEKSPFLPIRSKLLALIKEHGVRVHTVGVDRVTASFYYFEEGGAADPVRIEGNLVEMLSPSLEPTTSNTEIEALREDLIDRLLTKFSKGAVSELAVELADALPRLSTDGRGLVGTHLEIFEVQARALSSRSARFEPRAREIVRVLEGAQREGKDRADVPLYGEAREEVLPSLQVRLGGETVELPPRRRWIVKGALREQPAKAEIPDTAAAPVRARAPRPSEIPPSIKPKEAEAKAAEAPAEAKTPEAPETPEEDDESSTAEAPRARPSIQPAAETPRVFLDSALALRAFAVLLVLAALANAVWRTISTK